MMKEIKFRRYKTRLKKMAYEQELKRELGMYWLDCAIGYSEPMQYIGLKDKKTGRRVWARDIISHRNIDKIETDGVVHFDWRGACIIVSDRYVRLDMIPNWWVIGNIYENPELLKVK